MVAGGSVVTAGNSSSLNDGASAIVVASAAAVERYGLRIPPFAETQNYVRVIAGRYLSRRSTKSDVRPATGVAPPLPEPVAASKTDRPSVAWRMSVSFEPK